MEIRLQYIKKIGSLSRSPKREVSFHDPAIIRIGRETGCELVLECSEKAISRQHVIIKRAKKCYLLTDTSANGTYLNKESQPIGLGNTINIHNNDILRIGNYLLLIKMSNRPSFKTISPSKNTTKPRAIELNQKPQSATPNRDNTPDSSNTNNLIPTNWDIDINLKGRNYAKAKPTKVSINSLNFNQDQTLVKNLLKGLGICDENLTENLSADDMLTLGRCLRVSISGVIKQQNHVNKLKEKLLKDKKHLQNGVKATSSANFTSPNEFLIDMLVNSHDNGAKYPLELAKAQNEILEDQAAIYDSFVKAMDSLRDELSPHRIENHFESSSHSFANKLFSSAGKWNFYKKRWADRCMSFKNMLQEHLNENFKQLYRKRSQQRSIKKQ